MLWNPPLMIFFYALYLPLRLRLQSPLALTSRPTLALTSPFFPAYLRARPLFVTTSRPHLLVRRSPSAASSSSRHPLRLFALDLVSPFASCRRSTDHTTAGSALFSPRPHPLLSPLRLSSCSLTAHSPLRLFVDPTPPRRFVPYLPTSGLSSSFKSISSALLRFGGCKPAPL